MALDHAGFIKTGLDEVLIYVARIGKVPERHLVRPALQDAVTGMRRGSAVGLRSVRVETGSPSWILPQALGRGEAHEIGLSPIAARSTERRQTGVSTHSGPCGNHQCVCRPDCRRSLGDF